ncbi:hypothetical protein SASPL_127328 [Salvia splendens]|uniref:Histone deacetylase complex subunit SAP30 Sin3 binding domain-containing protein n=1 Tax=Salvia splendens TaxID=180675 RepID=A0A8X8XCV3_SALSN|nr:hypothetical protein SASPL_127328 [Salvia splendens]
MESCPLSDFRDESCEEELAVLPRHTKVIVTGNNRTKSVLVGLQGVVKKAVGLGGWHWLVLKNGVEVKLQRNALSVLEPPTGIQEDDEYDFDDSSSGSDMGENHRRFSYGLHLSKINKPKIRELIWQSSGLDHYGDIVEASTSWANISSHPTKEQLIKAVQQHFYSQVSSFALTLCKNYSHVTYSMAKRCNSSKRLLLLQKVDEVQVIVEFIRAAKRLE